MCGISGWFDIAGERAADRALAMAMNGAIRHRGPDGEGFHFAPGLALAHRRLAIIDLQTGDQPMFNRTRTIAIVFNGEIYNFRELRAELASLGHRFETNSDTEAIIHAWEEWGEDALNRLAGMFAFALWDEKKQILFLARDRLGEKPLYYSVLPDRTLIFGSELKALLAHPKLQRRIDACAVEEFFALGYIAEPRTIYEGVTKLPAGFCLTAQRGKAPALRCYWRPKPAENVRGTIDQLADSLVERLSAAVKSQLVSDVPIGAFLSGGVDSSGTAAMMAMSVNEPVRCFTIGFTDPKFDETRYAAAVANRYGAQHIVERMTGTETDYVGRLPAIFDEPFGDSSALPALYLAELARRHVTVALSGDAGDELFAGYRRYAFHASEESIRSAFPAWLRRPLFGALASCYPELPPSAPRFLRARHTFKELSLDSALGYFWNLSVVDDGLRERLFTGNLKNELRGYHASEVVLRHWPEAPDRDPVAIAQYIDLKTWLPGDILTKVDRTAMAVGLETRIPMLDHRFVEWALALPRAAKIAGGHGKIVLKRAFERLVPKEVLYRPKQGFSVPLAEWFRGDLGESFRADASGKDGLIASGYIESATVEALLGEHASGLHDHSRTLWLLWMFQRFLVEVHSAPTARAPAFA
jgi:asparagine synthase (glutamine-hydrolysing)